MSNGRASAASLTVISGNGVEQIRRPKAPFELSREAANEWTAIVNRMPPDWFPRETHAMLTQYCRLVVRAAQVDKLFSARKNLTLSEFQRLLRMEQQTSDSIAKLATKMRISQQATYDKRKKKDYTPKNQPWEEEEAS